MVTAALFLPRKKPDPSKLVKTISLSPPAQECVNIEIKNSKSGDCWELKQIGETVNDQNGLNNT